MMVIKLAYKDFKIDLRKNIFCWFIEELYIKVRNGDIKFKLCVG